MADTADRRSEGKGSINPVNVRAREIYHSKASRGLCVFTGCTHHTKGRKYCYAHSDYQVNATYLSGLRSFLKEVEIDPNEADQAADTLLAIRQQFSGDAALLLEKLAGLMRVAQKQRKEVS